MGFTVGDKTAFVVGIIVVFGEGLGVLVGDFFPFGVAEGVAEGVTGPGVGV